jgi:beta-1,4-mannosyltransferase
MLNHGAMLGTECTLVGYSQADSNALAGIPIARIPVLAPIRGGSSKLWFLAHAALRMCAASVMMLYRLMRLRPRVILIQNPPSLPSLLLASIAARAHQATLIIDWHNYGFSMLAMRFGRDDRLVRWAEWYEGVIGRWAHHHICVSQALASDLANRYGITARVLRDLPLRILPRQPDEVQRIVCPAGWTADEDMEMLLEAISMLTPASRRVFHLTGDGPLLPKLAPRIEQLRSAGHAIHTGFLPTDEYWELISRAALGISMHASSSALDLAMKVVDLHSAQVPVIAFDYAPVVREQVPEPMLFRNAAELAHRIDSPSSWLAPPPVPLWRDAWRTTVEPILAA